MSQAVMVRCSHCDAWIPWDRPGEPLTCPHCLHRADLPQTHCTCAACAGGRNISDLAAEWLARLPGRRSEGA